MTPRVGFCRCAPGVRQVVHEVWVFPPGAEYPELEGFCAPCLNRWAEQARKEAA